MSEPKDTILQYPLPGMGIQGGDGEDHFSHYSSKSAMVLDNTEIWRIHQMQYLQ